MLERTDAITNQVLETIAFVLTYPTVFRTCRHRTNSDDATSVYINNYKQETTGNK